MNRDQEAINIFKKLLEQKPKDVDVLKSLGKLARELGNYDESIDYYNKILEIDPKNVYALQKKAVTLVEQKKYNEAIELMTKVLEINPNSSLAQVDMGHTLICAGKPQEAIPYLQKALGLEPNNAYANYNLGTVYMRLHQAQDALPFLEKAVKILPYHLLFSANLGKCLKQLGRESEALAELNRAAEIVKSAGYTDNMSITHKKFVDNILKKDRQELLQKLVKLDQESKQLAETVKQLDQSNPEVKQIAEKMEDLKKNSTQVISKGYDNLVEGEKDQAKLASLEKEMAECNRQLEAMKALIAKLEQVQLKHEEALVNAGVYDKAEIKKAFDAFLDIPKLHNYSKTFYWCLLNYFTAYRSLSTGLVQGNVDFDESSKEILVVKGLKKAASVGVGIAKSIPFVGGILSGMEDIIDSIYSMKKERRLQHKINIITGIIIDNIQSEEDLSLILGKAAILITNAKKNAILHPKQPEGDLSKGLGWLSSKIGALVEKIQQGVQECAELYDTEEKKLALQDVTLLLSYLYKNYNSLNISKSLDEQFKAIVVDGSLDTFLIDAFNQNNEGSQQTMRSDIKESTNRQTSCCSIF